MISTLIPEPYRRALCELGKLAADHRDDKEQNYYLGCISKLDSLTNEIRRKFPSLYWEGV